MSLPDPPSLPGSGTAPPEQAAPGLEGAGAPFPALVRPVLLLAVGLGLLALLLPWVNFRPNRLVLGEGRSLWEVGGSWAPLLPALWALPLGCGWLSPRLQRWLAPLLYAGLALLVSGLLGQAATALADEANPFARVSPAGGLWLSVGALYVAGFAVSRVSRLAGPLGALAFAAPVVAGHWAKLGLLQEYANVADSFGNQLATHVALSVLALLLAAVVGLPLGVLAARQARLSGAVLGGAGFLQTLPSVALFGLLLPLFSALGRGATLGAYLAVVGGALLAGLGLTRLRGWPAFRLAGGLLALVGLQGALLLLGLGLFQALPALGGGGLSGEALRPGAPLSDWGVRGIGSAPALFTLTLYALLPIVVNTFVGLRSVPPGLSDAARGMGLTPQQVLWRAELPVALPFILEGLRSSLVLTFGITTIAALIGAGGLGFFIQRGVESNVPDLVLLGALPIVLLALLLSEGLRLISTWLTPRGLRGAEGAHV